MLLLAHAAEINLSLSFVLGALHALEPGHGKTAMLVYLSSGPRRYLHAFVMAFMTALSHSLSLVVIAAVVHATHHLVTGDHEHDHPVSEWLGTISGLLILVVGAGMMFRAARGKGAGCCDHSHADHDHAKETTNTTSHNHEPNDQVHSLDAAWRASTANVDAKKLLEAHQPVDQHVESHSCCSHHAKLATKRSGGFGTSALLGLAVGLLPCPSALAAFLTGLASGKPQAAYLVIFLFALGIMFSLTLVGWALQFLGRRTSFPSQMIGKRPWTLIPPALIICIGLYYTFSH
jgi:ABC-type nickel/cobalt efflux system permease component RcnA